MGNLIPQLRADINGKLVTRHVKDEGNAPAAKRSFAAPTIKPQTSAVEGNVDSRPLKKLKKRKVPVASVDIAALRSADKKIAPGTVEMSDENIYHYLNKGLTMAEAVALKSMGVEYYEWNNTPEQGAGEADGVYATRIVRFNNEVKRINERRDRYSDVAHRLELRGIPADVASKSIENGLSMKALSGFLTESEVCEIYSKNGYLKNNMKVMDDLVNGVIPFEYYKQFGMRNLNNWEKNCPTYRQLPTELVAEVIDKAKSPLPSIGSASPSEAQLMKMAVDDNRVLELRVPELMWHSFRIPKDGGVFSFEEAKVVDDFIHEVRSRGITDLTEQRRSIKALPDPYPTSEWDSTYECKKILDWHNAGLSDDQIILGMQNRWNQEQAVSVYLEDTAASLADGIL